MSRRFLEAGGAIAGSIAVAAISLAGTFTKEPSSPGLTAEAQRLGGLSERKEQDFSTQVLLAKARARLMERLYGELAHPTTQRL